MSDPSAAPPTPPASPPPNRAAGWAFAVSGIVLLVLSLGCVVAVTDGNPFSEDGVMGVVCASPALALGGVFLWLGSRRLKR
jgi:peptidoglycan/LPS O-acetylase OafA/YrhL